MSPAVETLSFASPAAWRDWLTANHSTVEGIWMRIYKKGSGIASVDYAQALDQALCFGWIDGQKKPLDEESWLQKFTPRRTRSGWSKRNTEHAESLIREGLMTEAGLREVEAAKADGRWEGAYDSHATATVPDDFIQRLSKNPKALAFFDSLNKANRYAIIYRLQTAKRPETRERRMVDILAMMERGERFH